MKYLYDENCRTFMMKIEEDTKGKISHVHGLEQLIL